MRPENISDDAWSGKNNVIGSGIGTKWGDYVKALAEDANALYGMGYEINDVGTLFGYRLQQASGLTFPKPTR